MSHSEDPPSVRLHLGAEEACPTLSPDAPDSGLPDLLARHEAESLAFVPLLTASRLRRLHKKVARARGGDARGNALDRALEKARASVADTKEPIDWHAGVLEISEEDGSDLLRIPSVFAYDLRRYRARLAAEALGLEEFYWASGEEVERHQVAPFGDGEAFDWGSVRDRARVGLRDMARTSTEFGDPIGALSRAGVDLRRFVLAAVCVLALALAGLAYAPAARSWDAPNLVHPLLVVFPLFFYLRPRSREEGGSTSDRELTATEAAQAWLAVTPHTLAVWVVAFVGVLLLSLGRAIGAQGFDLVDVFDSTTRHSLTLFWALTPLTYVRGRTAALGAVIESAVIFFVALFVLKFTFIITNIATGIFWSIVDFALPVTVPDWIRVPLSTVAEIGTQGLFFVVIAGYIWERNRETFGKWATVGRSEDSGTSPASSPSS